eukprot:gnl/TRDRNA2_/TRDRNA2_171492_c0_seq1.p1 gnl/TRDRNA2_/TRDRNA2_171492_c0~~gnl/TRDRNA2_/TRDRNA2_171492_c0_seq1.p1  ORF type:complete len:1103 (+),score=237.74 gnl/TRDRNA2_/TRDRNA2_171492_c0_seq1:268-3309(+)
MAVEGATISREEFRSLAASLGGGSTPCGTCIASSDDSVAASTDEEANGLFEELAIVYGDGRVAVPFDIFAAEVCAESMPDSAARAVSLRTALLREISAAIKMKAPPAHSQIAEALGGDDPVDEARFREAIARLVSEADSCAVKALWCFLVRGRHGEQRLVRSTELTAHLPAAGEQRPSLKKSSTFDLSDDENDTDLPLPMCSAREVLEDITPFASRVLEDITPFATPCHLAQREEAAAAADLLRRSLVGVHAVAADMDAKQGKADEQTVGETPDKVEDLRGRIRGVFATGLETADLARALNKVQAQPQELSKKEQLLHSIMENPQDSLAWVDLGETLGEDEPSVCVALPEGKKTYTQQEIFLKAIELDASCARAYCDLGAVMSSHPGATITLRGRVFNEKELYLHAIEKDPMLVSGYQNLSEILNDTETVLILGQEHTKSSLWQKATDVQRDLEAAKKAALNGGDSLPIGSTVAMSSPAASSRPVGSPQSDRSPLGVSGAWFSPAEVRCEPPASLESVKSPSLVSQGLAPPLPQLPKRRLQGLSPLFRPKDLAAVFEDADADKDGVLGLQDLLTYLGDYLCYGNAEISAFHKAYTDDDGKGVTPDALKRGLKVLNPYLINKHSNKLIARRPGAFGGREGIDLQLEELSHCTVLICDRTEQVFVDEISNCMVLVGPCDSATFLRNCKDCTFWIVTRQLRTRDCENCTIYLHTETEPVIETSQNMSFAPLSAEYPGLSQQFSDAKFNARSNFWSAVFDFNGRPDGSNWQFTPLEKCEALVVSFERDPTRPESPFPLVTQELLLAPPPVSQNEDGTGHSVASIPQTRPPPPPAPQRRHPETGQLVDRPQMRFLTDRDDDGREGRLDVESGFDASSHRSRAAAGSSAVFASVPESSPLTVLGSMQGGDSDDDISIEEMSPSGGSLSLSASRTFDKGTARAATQASRAASSVTSAESSPDKMAMAAKIATKNVIGAGGIIRDVSASSSDEEGEAAKYSRWAKRAAKRYATSPDHSDTE